MRRLLIAAFAVYLLSAAYLVFWPQPDTPAGTVDAIEAALEGVGITVIPGAVIEFALNVLLFVPFALFAVLLWPRVNPMLWVAVGVGGTVLIEAVQYVVLPDRSAALTDLVANALGTLLGIDLGLRLHFRFRDRSGQLEGDGSP